MEDMKQEFISKFYSLIIRYIIKNARKYSPSMLGYDSTTEYPLKNYIMDLSHDFMTEVFLNDNRFRDIYYHQGEVALVSYLRKAISNFLKDRVRHNNPRSARLWKNISEVLKQMQEEGTIMPDKGKFRAINSSSNRSIDDQTIFAVINQNIYEIFDMSKNQTKINKPPLKSSLEKIFKGFDGLVSVKDIHEALTKVTFLEDIKITLGDEAVSIFPPEESDADLSIRLKEAMNKLTPRQLRIYELKTSGESLTNEEIARILSEEGMGCDHSTVSREWNKIQALFKDFLQK